MKLNLKGKQGLQRKQMTDKEHKTIDLIKYNWRTGQHSKGQENIQISNDTRSHQSKALHVISLYTDIYLSV